MASTSSTHPCPSCKQLTHVMLTARFMCHRLSARSFHQRLFQHVFHWRRQEGLWFMLCPSTQYPSGAPCPLDAGDSYRAWIITCNHCIHLTAPKKSYPAHREWQRWFTLVCHEYISWERCIGPGVVFRLVSIRRKSRLSNSALFKTPGLTVPFLPGHPFYLSWSHWLHWDFPKYFEINVDETQREKTMCRSKKAHGCMSYSPCSGQRSIFLLIKSKWLLLALQVPGDQLFLITASPHRLIKLSWSCLQRQGANLWR